LVTSPWSTTDGGEFGEYTNGHDIHEREGDQIEMMMHNFD